MSPVDLTDSVAVLVSRLPVQLEGPDGVPAGGCESCTDVDIAECCASMNYGSAASERAWQGPA